jgi:hypothetical protein
MRISHLYHSSLRMDCGLGCLSHHSCGKQLANHEHLVHNNVCIPCVGQQCSSITDATTVCTMRVHPLPCSCTSHPPMVNEQGGTYGVREGGVGGLHFHTHFCPSACTPHGMHAPGLQMWGHWVMHGIREGASHSCTAPCLCVPLWQPGGGGETMHWCQDSMWPTLACRGGGCAHVLPFTHAPFFCHPAAPVQATICTKTVAQWGCTPPLTTPRFAHHLLLP